MTEPAARSPYWPPELKPATRSSPWRLIRNFLLSGIGGGVIGAGFILLAKNIHWPGIELYRDALRSASGSWLLIFALLTLWPQIILHEAGHAFAGLSRGMRAAAIGIGPWRWERSEEGWRFRYAGGVRGISGFALLLPQGRRGLSRWDQALYLLGGPGANLICLACILWILPMAAGAPILAAFFYGTAIPAALLGFINLLPFKAGGFNTDGRNLLDLLFNTKEAEQARRIRQVMGLNMIGVRPRDWPLDAVPMVPAESNRPLSMVELNALSLRFSRAIDTGNFDSARECARRMAPAIADVPEALIAHVAIGMASFAALVERDRELLAAWRPLCEGGLMDLTGIRAWLDAELAMLSGNTDAAREAIVQARKVRTRVPDEVSARLLGEYIDALESRVDLAMTAHVKDA
jgi:hypothetical protein